MKDLKNFENLFDFSTLSEKHELCSKKIKKVIARFKTETLKNFHSCFFICLRSKMYAFKCGDDSKKEIKRCLLIFLEKK